MCLLTNLVGLRYLEEAPANGVGHTTSRDKDVPSSSLKPGYDQGSPERKVSRGTKEVNFDVGDSRRSSNSVYVPNESDSEEGEASEQELDLLDDTSRIPKYALLYSYKDYCYNSIRSLVLVFLEVNYLHWCGHDAGQKSKVSSVLCVLMSKITACERQTLVPFSPVMCGY